MSTLAPLVKVQIVTAPHSQYAVLMEEGAADLAVG